MFAEIQNITVYYNKSLAIKDVTVKVPEAGVVSIIGANGAGKSTILKALVGLVAITSGDVALRRREHQRAGDRGEGQEGASSWSPKGGNCSPISPSSPTSSWERLCAGTRPESPSPSNTSSNCFPASRNG